VTTLVRPEQPPDDLDQLRARVAALEATRDERAADADRLNRELDMFAAEYRQKVGTLHEELDQIEIEIAEAELGELSKKVAEGRRDADGDADAKAGDASTRSGAGTGAAASAGPRFTSDAVRKLFREVARAIHPDLANDEDTRDRRHALMIEANRAYALRDAEHLERILAAWGRSPEAVAGSDPASIRLRLERRLAQLEEQIEIYGRDVAALQASPLFELKKMVDEASGRGRDLIADMVRRLKRDIMAAANRRDAMRSVP
jgi:hypothetical protein